MEPLIIFSYGMTKCGSTLAFQLVRTALEQLGYVQPRLSKPALGNDRNINFVQFVEKPMAVSIWQEVQAIGHPVVIKTHAAPSPAVRRLLKKGMALGQAAYRDPRDMALSMIDSGRAARASGAVGFSHITDLNTALAGIRYQCGNLSKWLSLPNVLPLCYDDIAFDTKATAARILAQLNMPGDPGRIAAIARSRRFIQLNKGVADRHVLEMLPDDSTGISQEFQPLIDILIKGRAKLSQSNPVLEPGFALSNPDKHYLATPLAGPSQ